MDITYRLASLDDAQEIVGIYAYYVRNSAYSFEYDPPTVDEYRERMSHVMRDYPFIVAVRDGEVVGYAYAHRFAERAAYRFDVELSVYTRYDMNRSGIGRGLYSRLFALLRKQGVCNAYACVTWPNEPSLAFHAAMGFKRVGRFKKAGYKFGAWHDVVWLEKFLCRHGASPLFIRACDLPGRLIDSVMTGE